ncbi:XRE family transcriptional regulator [Mycetocola tolaasinivorans]|uniref:XRE family transcriptional regulator n=1 Tax=Mycetocola tolaasinivorans TaxID=76635 RepID=A0A3L7A8F3_9MICO|nr:helix-turn-helix transcriptional regulator [Mycetocola tolaasinivorans]RLP76447.1 XRE family transcriptional regulator [Mycetocola tolaasinivorans]
MDIDALIRELGKTPSETARATGLSRMTVQRVRDGASSPGIATLREFALAAGYDISVSLVPTSDPLAALAARALLDPAFRAHLPAAPDVAVGSVSLADSAHATDSRSADTATLLLAHPEVRAWIARFDRWNAHTPDEILAVAGRASAPQHRAGARYFRPRPGFTHERFLKLLGLAASSGHGDYALSGVPVADLYLGGHTLGPTVLWTTDAEGVAARIGETLHEDAHFQPAGVIIAPTPPDYLIDSVSAELPGLRIVSPIQAALDLHGLGFTERAALITEGW